MANRTSNTKSPCGGFTKARGLSHNCSVAVAQMPQVNPRSGTNSVAKIPLISQGPGVPNRWT